VSGCGTVVCSGTIKMLRGARVPSNGGLVVMGTVGFTMLHSREMGKPELPPPPSSSTRGCVTLVDKFLENGM
jgi:hypothetical protein